MNIDEAKKTIRDDSAGHIGWAMAASILVQNTPRDGDQTDFFRDMLIALERGGVAGGAAVCALHGRTKRPWPEEIGGTRDANDWLRYLTQNDFLSKASAPS